MKREILFRGFNECGNGTQIAVVDGVERKGEWVYGGAFKQRYKDKPPLMCIITPYEATDIDGI
ncbi:hypothetical protein EOM82_07710 [bacterium]|nr:hypothetical protein [bacterium]